MLVFEAVELYLYLKLSIVLRGLDSQHFLYVPVGQTVLFFKNQWINVTNAYINIAVNTIFKYNPDFTISKVSLKKLFSFATCHTHFLFNGCFYDQIDGVAMAHL